MRTQELYDYLNRPKVEEETFVCEGCGDTHPISQKERCEWSNEVCPECEKLFPCDYCGELTTNKSHECDKCTKIYN